MLARRYNLYSEPDNPTGAPLAVALEIVLPEGTTNLFLNPSWETNTTNWTNSSDGSSGTPYQRSTTRQFKGAYSAQLTIRPTNGTYGQLVNASISNATQYSMSFHVRRSNGGIVRGANCKAFVNGAVTDWDSISYIAGGWYRVEKTWLSTSTSGVGIRVIGSPGNIFYVDAAQLEAKGYCTTYCDGDQPGLLPIESPPAYYWTGTPHASTSVRSGTTRAGGRPMSVARYGLTILALIGLGFSQRSVISTPLGLADGNLYQRTIRESREFTIAGMFDGSDPRSLSARRGALRSLLSHDLSGVDQPLVMRLQRFDGRDPIGDQVTIAASYLEGLGEEMTQPFDEKVSVQFQSFLPALMSSGSRGTTLSPQTSVSNANYILQRSAAGAWSALGTGANAQVTNVIETPDGSLYAAGDFTSIGGVAANYIARWNGSSWAALGTGTNASVRALAVGPDGSLYVGGNFTSAGGVANTAYIARWNGSAWSALGTGMGDAVLALAFAPSGTLYAAGAFTTAGGGAANRVASWNGSAWSALGTGIAAGSGLALVVGPDNSLYLGGNFATVGGVTANYIARWNGSAWSALGTGADNIVQALAFAPNGTLYAGGVFNTIGGLTIRKIAGWNGSAWADIGANMPSGSQVFVVRFAPDNNMYIGGLSFSTVAGIVLPDNAALWTGSAWSPVPIDLPGTASVSDFFFSRDGALTVAYNTSGTATAASVTTVSNPGTIPAGFALTITGPTSGTSRIYSITNNRTGSAVYFDLALSAGETAYLTATGNTLSLRTSFRGAINSAILPGSDYDFALVKGSNSLSLFAASSTVTATLSFTPQYESLDDATLTPALQ
jgi:hypothetical protein